jgi:mono/diheme cytochrome c family protein
LTYWSRSGGNAGKSIKLPQLTTEAQAGRKLFEVKCIACHGKNATGTKNGPPLVHKIYEPNHHSDISFYRAVAQGTRAHHWRFGNMPPVSGVRKDEVAKIIGYVRELQRANGIK